MKRIVIAVVKVVGFHQWTNAPDIVKYLASQHRHLFTIRVEVVVGHGDREVEFHTLQRLVLHRMAEVFRFVAHGGSAEFDFGERSCEHIAQDLGKVLKAGGLLGVRAIEVWEDDENGGRIEWP